MWNQIYVKYSNQRSPKYQIRTEILQNEYKEKKVRKIPLTIEAKKHIVHIKESYDLLKKFYNENDLYIPTCTLSNDAIEMEYIEGESLSQLLESYYNNGEIEKVYELLKEYKAKVTTGKLTSLEVTPKLQEIFGNIECYKEQQALSISDIDLTFDNIIISNNQWCVIDYEWTFDFKIPVDFILYRAIVNYEVTTSERSKMVNELKIYEYLGLSKETVYQCQKMDEAFQQYVRGKVSILEQLNYLISPLEYSIKNLDNNNRNIIKIYLDYGTGFHEANCINVMPTVNKNDEINFKIETLKLGKVEKIRIDPCSCPCLVRINYIYGHNPYFFAMDYKHNGNNIFDDMTIFDNDDPQFILQDIPVNNDYIEVNFSIMILTSKMANDIKNKSKAYISRYEKTKTNNACLNNKVAELEKENTALAVELNHYKAHYGAAMYQKRILEEEILEHKIAYEIISNSTIWRATKPLRVQLDMAKRILKKNQYTRLLGKTLKCLKNHGYAFTLRKVKQYLTTKGGKLEYTNQIPLTEDELQYQRNYQFDRAIKFSILVPLYNTPLHFLKDMINSCIAQTYSNWELCMADGSDEEHNYVEEVVKKYQARDSRIKYKRLEKNEGISENTNKCLEMADGDYIALFDHDDILDPSALYEYMHAICEQDAEFIYCDEDRFENDLTKAFGPYYKSDFAIDSLRGNNYITHFTVFKKSLLEKVGGFRKECDGSQDHDMVLRLVEQTNKVVHIPKILYHWRVSPNSVASDISAKPYAIKAGIKAVQDHLDRIGLAGKVESTPSCPTMYRIRYEIEGNPLISILIPTKDHIDDLSKCISSIIKKSTYTNYEIIVIENNSTERETFEYYESLKSYKNIRVVNFATNGKFNFSAINNYGAKMASGDHLLFLNNDTEVITENWLEEMLMYSQRPDVGAVGAKLYYPDDTIQHAGVIVGIGGVAGHGHKNWTRPSDGYFGKLQMAQNYSAVTGACIMMRKDVFEEVGGLDEEFAVAYNDIDLCLRIRKAGYLIVWTPFAELYHYESKSRGYEDTPEKKARHDREAGLLRERWKLEIEKGDPYYNPNLTLDREDYSVK